MTSAMSGQVLQDGLAKGEEKTVEIIYYKKDGKF